MFSLLTTAEKDTSHYGKANPDSTGQYHKEHIDRQEYQTPEQARVEYRQLHLWLCIIFPEYYAQVVLGDDRLNKETRDEGSYPVELIHATTLAHLSYDERVSTEYIVNTVAVVVKHMRDTWILTGLLLRDRHFSNILDTLTEKGVHKEGDILEVDFGGVAVLDTFNSTPDTWIDFGLHPIERAQIIAKDPRQEKKQGKIRTALVIVLSLLSKSLEERHGMNSQERRSVECVLRNLGMLPPFERAEDIFNYVIQELTKITA